ncbi:MAG: GNAT family N-acetyltransferase [Anaerolineae bacterium]
MIETERTLLRPLSRQDAPALLSYRSLPEVYRYQHWAPGELDEALDFIVRYCVNPAIEEDDWRQLGIYHKAGGALIGDCGFRILEGEQAEIGYTIAPGHQRQGFGSEVVTSLVSYLFQEHHLQRVIARTGPDNIGSIRILRRIGFRQEVPSPRGVGTGGEGKEDLVFSTLREDWAAKK